MGVSKQEDLDTLILAVSQSAWLLQQLSFENDNDGVIRVTICILTPSFLLLTFSDPSSSRDKQ